jgi:hypothetical protein
VKEALWWMRAFWTTEAISFRIMCDCFNHNDDVLLMYALHAFEACYRDQY